MERQLCQFQFYPILVAKNNDDYSNDASLPSHVNFVPDPIDPFDLYLSHELKVEGISDDENKDINENIEVEDVPKTMPILPG